MNRDEVIAKWNSMSPREWDAWVGETVLNMKPGYNKNLNRHGWTTGERRWSSSIPGFTKDISAAWEVLKKFKTYQITYSESGFSHSGMEYRVIVGRNQDVAYSDIETEAICLAALIAVLTQGEGITE
ncbi:BC1872 family protein [Paenibacillus polymyxa]|uniref:BC1872 family protein n=1 Tax=Paenibacillus polymyxa TaxID=1406 RepID=UPI002ED5D682|nr:hypothetical protein [Paenibacillus polymyxa]